MDVRRCGTLWKLLKKRFDGSGPLRKYSPTNQPPTSFVMFFRCVTWHRQCQEQVVLQSTLKILNVGLRTWTETTGIKHLGRPNYQVVKAILFKLPGSFNFHLSNQVSTRQFQFFKPLPIEADSWPGLRFAFLVGSSGNPTVLVALRFQGSLKF